jgi:serine/threonine protein kinase
VDYPQPIDYQDAVQDPRNTFSDPELKVGTVAVNPIGLPVPMSGGFVLTYKMQTGTKRFAVRCFKREVPQAQSRYAQISTKLQSLGSPYFVDFNFQATGIRVHGKSYPIVKMDWVEGDTLGEYLGRPSLTPTAVTTLRQRFATLAEFLERNGVAHGDIQNENVMVSGNTLRLIDYDGMFVSGMVEGQGSEIGQRNFQHPGRTEKLFGPKMDRFSFIVLDVSFQALESEPSLHRKFGEGGQAIIFNANDYEDPSSSEIFRLLDKIPTVRDAAQKLAAICVSPVTSVPSLIDFRRDRGLPVTIETTHKTSRPAHSHVYIGAFPVLDASDFGEVRKRVGDKIEIVGQIVSVKEGVGRRGRGYGLPYVFINFGAWNRESVKVTIWSDGLRNMNTHPTEAWKGRWISVTGLVQPPFEGKHYGKPYRNIIVTVTSDNQIVQISEKEAKFRLRQGPRARSASGSLKTEVTPRPASHQTSRNAAILAEILAGAGQIQQAVPTRIVAPTPKTPTKIRPTVVAPISTLPSSPSSMTKNQQILATIQPRGVSPQASQSPSAPIPISGSPSPTPSSSSPAPIPRVSPPARGLARGWLWLVAMAALLLLGLLISGGH